ncbi:MAG TPA: GNAT family N-acetyltransferase [Acidobacteriaceae bacterium]|nr:GNAT family N-acetyltransferase [Acidobacteriaceae bacterium]
MTLPYVPASGQGIVIRRANLGEVETVLESVRNLAAASATAAHWSRVVWHPYLAPDVASSVLQAKALLLAVAHSDVGGTTKIDGENPPATRERILGFAAFSTIMAVDAGESTLENMVVAKPWQRQGIGWRLLTAGQLWCRAHASRTVFLEVRKSNRTAIALYQQAGFSVVGSRPGYYRDPTEDGLQMQKWLGLAARAC